jgi:hypothetical protein
MSTYAIVEEVASDSREIIVEGRNLLRGQTLASLVAELGGNDGEVIQPTTGARFPVSLDEWRDRDPHSTWLEVSFITELAAPRPT